MTCEVRKLGASEAVEYKRRRGVSGDKTSYLDPFLEHSLYNFDLSFHTWKLVVWLGNEE